jgi:hypothetical protein
MRNEPDSFAAQSFVGNDEIDVLFGTANENVRRATCLPRDVLAALARGERPLEDPAYEHLTVCSPCYREFRELQGTGTRTSESRPPAR